MKSVYKKIDLMGTRVRTNGYIVKFSFYEIQDFMYPDHEVGDRHHFEEKPLMSNRGTINWSRM